MEGINKYTKALKMSLAKGFLVVEKIDLTTHEGKDLHAFRNNRCKGNDTLGIAPCVHYIQKKDECNGCGCIIELKTETLTNREFDTGTLLERAMGGQIRKTHCPFGRWGDKITANIYRQIDGDEPIK